MNMLNKSGVYQDFIHEFVEMQLESRSVVLELGL
jgi:hypothetical protein